MDRESNIRSEISSLEGKIREYQEHINYLRQAETKIQTKLIFFEDDIYLKIKAYSISDNDYWLGDDADAATEQKDYHCKVLASLSSEVEDLIYDIRQTISKYETLITECRYRISSLKSELDAILEE